MNTLAWLAASGALLWLSIYCFTTLSNNMLGIATFMIFLVMLFGTVLAAHDDWQILHGGKGDDE